MALWGETSSKVTFVEAYNKKRHDIFDEEELPAGQEQKLVPISSSTLAPPTPKTPHSASRSTTVRSKTSLRATKTGSVTPMSSRSSGPSIVDSRLKNRRLVDSARGSYSMIRSDVEDDSHLAQPNMGTLPHMPNTLRGMRQRSVNHLHFLPTETAEEGPSYLDWVESHWFQVTSGAVIMCNAIVIGLETDIKSSLWCVVENILLSYFLFELIVRLLRHGLNFFRSEDDWAWNVFDFLIVTSGLADQWVMPILRLMMKSSSEAKKGGSTASVFMVMRMARLLRIVRLFRLVKIVRPLYELAQSVMEALHGMFWVLVFMIMTLYSIAILCTNFIGHGTILSEDDLEDPAIRNIQSMFGSVSESMFTLFGTVSSWSLNKFVPLFDEIPVLRPLFVVFYIYSAWALLAVMAGVVSENMIAIRQQMLKEDGIREEKRKSMITKMLLELFREADVDNSGTVSRQEFESMLKSPELVKKITANSRMKVQDLIDLFDWIDHDGGGTITIDEFMGGFKWVNEPLRAKSLVKLQERLLGDMKDLESSVNTAVEQRTAEVSSMVAAPLRKVHAIAEQLQNLDVQLGKMRPILRERAAGLPSQVELKQMEDRLSAKLRTTLDKLSTIEGKAKLQARRIHHR